MPISAFQLVSATKSGLLKTAKLPTEVLIYRSVIVGNLYPCPIDPRKYVSWASFNDEPSLKIGFVSVILSFRR